MIRGLSILLALTFVGCASAPPNLSPAATLAWNNTRVIRGLDVLRDSAIEANKQISPEGTPLLSEATTRKVVLYHASAITTIHATSSGWKAAVLTGLDEVVKDLPPKERAQLAPYVTLLKTILQGVSQ